jgi:hypothetical protein
VLVDELADELPVQLTDELTDTTLNDVRGRQTGAIYSAIAVKRELTDELTVTDKLAVCPPRTSDESEAAALYTDRFWFEKRRHALLLFSILLAEGSW